MLCDCPEQQPLCRQCIRIAVEEPYTSLGPLAESSNDESPEDDEDNALPGDFLDRCRRMFETTRTDPRPAPVPVVEINHDLSSFDPWDSVAMPWTLPLALEEQSPENFGNLELHPLALTALADIDEQDDYSTRPFVCTCGRPCRHYVRRSGCSKGAACTFCHDPSHRAATQRLRRRPVNRSL